MGQIATLLNDFEQRVITKIVKGEEVKEIVPKFRKGQKFPVIQMDFFWMTKEEKGGAGVDLGAMDYIRLTFPNGDKTKYFDMFEIREEDKR